MELLSFLVTCSKDNDLEIRNSALTIFAGIISNYGSIFSE